MLNLRSNFIWVEKSMLVFNNQEIETDAQGYLLDSQQWSEELIPLLAQQEDIEITNEHLEIIRFVRNLFEFNTTCYSHVG